MLAQTELREKDEVDTLMGGRTGGFSSRQKQVIAGGVAAIVVISLVVVLVLIFAVPSKTSPKRNVIMMISDGWGPAAATLTRTFSGKPLSLDPYLVGTVRTFSANSLVTDSAAGATAYSCGEHTYNGGIGVDASAVACGTVLEAASRKGMRTGIVSTTRVTDATPGAFASHAADRKYEDYIAYQELDLIGFEKHMDVILGGGRAHFNRRKDGLNLLETAKSKGYTVALNSQDLANVTHGKVLGLFADDNMAYSLDRINNPTINATQPSLSVMVTKALELLDNEDGFFAMFEGALIDVAEHNNDAASAIQEVLGYSEAFAIVLDYAKKHGNTIVISTSDHETGGMTLGLQTNFTPGFYPPYIYYPQYLASVNASSDTMATRIKAGEPIPAVIASSTNITDLTDAELATITENVPARFEELSGAIGKIISARSLIGFTTHGHTGVDVNLYIYGLEDSDLEYTHGNVENINIATLIANLLDLDVPAITAEVQLFNTTGPKNRKRGEIEEAHDHYHGNL